MWPAISVLLGSRWEILVNYRHKFLSHLILQLHYDACSAHARDYRLIYANDVICVGKSRAFARAIIKLPIISKISNSRISELMKNALIHAYPANSSIEK